MRLFRITQATCSPARTVTGLRAMSPGLVRRCHHRRPRSGTRSSCCTSPSVVGGIAVSLTVWWPGVTCCRRCSLDLAGVLRPQLHGGVDRQLELPRIVFRLESLVRAQHARALRRRARRGDRLAVVPRGRPAVEGDFEGVRLRARLKHLRLSAVDRVGHEPVRLPTATSVGAAVRVRVPEVRQVLPAGGETHLSCGTTGCGGGGTFELVKPTWMMSSSLETAI